MIKLCVAFVFIAACAFHTAESTQCERDYEKKGCIPEGQTKLDLIVNHRMIINWKDMHFSNRRLICECSKKARAGGYEYFEIRFWAECWAGKDLKKMAEIIQNGQRSDKCVSGDFKKCNDADEKDCVGTDRVGYVYHVKPSVDGGLSAWSSFSACSKSCAGGVQSRTRSCSNPAPMYGGKKCVGNLSESQKCNSQQCPVDGGLSEWSSFSSCSKKCGGGDQSRTRSCSNPAPQFGGKKCEGDLKEKKKCNSQSCPVDGGLSAWSSYSACSKSCAGGTHFRTRDCNKPFPQFGGKNCVGSLKETKKCSPQPCPVDGGLSTWSSFSACSKSCAGGVQTRTRSCSNPAPIYGGKKCAGHLSESQSCNSQQCPVNGAYSAWSGWQGCSKTCGGGTQNRHRGCTSPSPAYGGTQCAGVARETRRCNTNPCVCNNFRFVARGMDCKSNVYTRVGGRCDGWPRMSFEECKRRCLRNDAPGGCPRRPCKYVIHDKNPGTPPGWCQLATDGCRLGRTNNGHVTYVRGC